MTRDEIMACATKNGWQESEASKRRQYDDATLLVLQYGSGGERCVITFDENGSLLRARVKDGRKPLRSDEVLDYLSFGNR